MKRILITGANSYVGTSLENYVKQWPDKYRVDTISLHGDAWREKNFGEYDSIFHVAGIAHSDTGRASKETKAKYYRINTDLTIEVAKKAKIDGAKQFIFMSSIIVYGDSAPIGKKKVITKDTIPCPSNFYGDSKLQAENGIVPLNDASFHVVIIRAPMIYGKGSKGNYALLSKLAQKLPVFPYVENERSSLYIGNLVEFVRLMLENSESGIFWPQNTEYANTCVLVQIIAAVHGKRVRLIKGFALPLRIASILLHSINKAFSNLTYDYTISQYKDCYQKTNLATSIKEAEGNIY